MKFIQNFSIIFTLGLFISLTACQKKDETKPASQAAPQEQPLEEKEQKKDALNENKKDEDNSNQKNKDQKVSTKPEETQKLDTSKVKIENISVDEGTFAFSFFNAQFENSIRENNVQNLTDSDLGLLSTVKFHTSSQSKIDVELSLHLVSSNKVVILHGQTKDKNSVLHLKSDEEKIEALLSCADDQCVFVTGYTFLKAEDKNIMLGTFIFKFVENEYRSVRFSEEKNSADENQTPPILRAEKHLNEGIQKFGEKIIADLKTRVKKENAWYSPYAFLINLMSERTILTLHDQNKFSFQFKQIFNKASETTRLKDYELRFEGALGTPVSAADSAQGIEVTWTQVTKNFGFGIFKTDKYISNRDPESKVRTAYFLFWCGFEGVSVNNATTQIEKCEYLGSATLVGDVGEGFILEEKK